MKSSTKFLLLVVFFSFLSFNVVNGKSITNYTFPAREGDKYTWKCTYCSSSWSIFLGVGSKVEININRIYNGSYMEAEEAHIINVTLNYYYKASNSHNSFTFPYYIVYNETFHYMRILHCFILLTPVNLTFVADYITRSGDNSTIQGNILNIDYGYSQTGQYTYNTDGFAEKFEYREFGITQYILRLGFNNISISLGNYYFMYIIMFIVIIAYFTKKRRKHLK
jgi:hypothetical protein